MKSLFKTETHDFFDKELVMVINSQTGEYEKFSKTRGVVGTMKEAINYIKENKQERENSVAIIKINAIVGEKI